MSSLLLLAVRMVRGYGVDLVVANVAQRLADMGQTVTVGCMEKDGTYGALRVERVDPTADAVARLADEVGATLVVAHTSPFFEVLPQLAGRYAVWAWEFGDPTPAFFDTDGAERQRQKEHKARNVYGRLSGVMTCSDFLRLDLPFPEASVVRLGCDHAPDLGPKGRQVPDDGVEMPLRVGTLMRLGPGEARYKGNRLFRDLRSRVRSAGLLAEFSVMGRGTPSDAAPFLEDDIKVELNATEEEKWRYLRSLDVFVASSLWEGFDLPLVEAQAVGTVGLAFDTGAHPETTPILTSNLDEAVTLIVAYDRNRELLLEHSRVAYRYVRSRFRWADTASEVARILGLSTPTDSGTTSERRGRGRAALGQGIGRRILSIANPVRRYLARRRAAP